MYLVWMWMMRWMNGNGNWGNSDPAVQRQLQTLQEQMQDNHNSDLMMQAIKGNSQALQDLSTRLSCDSNALQAAIQNVQSSIATVGSQVGFSSERIINAVNQGDCGVIQAIKDCCCQTQQSILKMGYDNQIQNQNQTYQLTNSINDVKNTISRGFCDNTYITQAQTCALQNTIRDTSTTNTNQIIAKLDAMQNQALLDKIDALREKNSQQAVIINNAQQSNLFSQMINAATAPINASLAGLTKEVSDIQCKLPSTVTLPQNNTIAVPTCVAAQYGLCGLNSTNNLWA